MSYPIGQPGRTWGDEERAQWLSRQTIKRSYEQDVLGKVHALKDRFDVCSYGELVYGPDRYPLRALKSRQWSQDRPTVLVTGGVHGYETSGVHGALLFALHGQCAVERSAVQRAVASVLWERGMPAPQPRQLAVPNCCTVPR